MMRKIFIMLESEDENEDPRVAVLAVKSAHNSFTSKLLLFHHVVKCNNHQLFSLRFGL